MVKIGYELVGNELVKIRNELVKMGYELAGNELVKVRVDLYPLLQYSHFSLPITQVPDFLILEFVFWRQKTRHFYILLPNRIILLYHECIRYLDMICFRIIWFEKKTYKYIYLVCFHEFKIHVYNMDAIVRCQFAIYIIIA